jgi:hypothetical protein
MSDAPAPSAQSKITIGTPHFAVASTNRSVLHAVRSLAHFGASLVGVKSLAEAAALEPRALAVFVAGDSTEAVPDTRGGGANASALHATPTQIWLWDYEVGRPGVGTMASAVSGVSAVIGEPGGPPGVLPAHIPEKWCGLFGASLAMGLQLAVTSGSGPLPRRIDVSAADALRAFAEQNSGNHAGVPYGWRRNGRVAVEHGGVFPQGFFPCRDGHVAIQARSRPDWLAILAALGNPPWSQQKAFQNPFTLSEDDREVRPLLEAELASLDRRELLDRAIATGAPMAPVLSPTEAAQWQVFRPGFADGAGGLNMPYTVCGVASAGHGLAAEPATMKVPA